MFWIVQNYKQTKTSSPQVGWTHYIL